MNAQTMMENFSLHPRLAADCFELGKLTLSRLLLLNNAHYKWLILVPEVSVEQLHLMSAEERQTLQAEAQEVSALLEEHYAPRRINVGALGNLVPQLHYHIVARTEDDPAWPGPVWGHEESISYTEAEIEAVRSKLFG